MGVSFIKFIIEHNYLFAFIAAIGITILFDYLMFKWDQKKYVDYQWQLLNEKLEREGRPRLDQKKKKKKK